MPMPSPMRSALKEFALPVFAIAAALLLFGVLVAFAGVDPVEVWATLFKGAFGDWFSWQNTLTRAAPLILTALCTALPAQLGIGVVDQRDLSGGRARRGHRHLVGVQRHHGGGRAGDRPVTPWPVTPWPVRRVPII